MLRDHSLVPAEALRVIALGMLAEEPHRYAELAGEIQHFVSHIVGPSLELMGTSVELLRYEGLIEAVEGNGMEDNGLLRLTTHGREALQELLTAALRAPAGPFLRLFLALKLRFLHLLSAEEQRAQMALIAAWYRAELERIEALRDRHGSSSGLFLGWLDLQAAQIRAQLDWLRKLAEGETATSA